MENSGPLIHYWCWVMERFCGRLSRAITSRRFPYPSLNRRILEHQTLQILRNTYDLQDRLPNYTRMHDPANMPTHSLPDDYPYIKALRHPRRVLSFKDHSHFGIRTRVAACLATYFKTKAFVTMPLLPADFEQWGRIEIKSGDTVYAHIGSGRREAENRRDASYIQYEQKVDIFAHQGHQRSVFRQRTFFGRVDRIIVVTIAPSPRIRLLEPETFYLLDVHICNTTVDRWKFHTYTERGRHEVIDASCLRAVVGRIYDRGEWVIAKRLGGIEHADYVAEEEDY